jgi:hypothetical protein
MTEETTETTEIIETAPAPFQMPVVDPILMPPMMQPMGGQAQQTIVKLGYDKDGNIASIYERRW